MIVKNKKEYGWAIYSWRNIIKVVKVSYSNIDNKYRWEEGYMKGKCISNQGVLNKIIVRNKEDIPNAIEYLQRSRKELHEYMGKFNNMEYIVESY